MTGLCGYGLQWNGALVGNINMGFDFTLSSRITERLLQEGCRSVIDFGCGTADMIKELNYRGVHVLGLDGTVRRRQTGGWMDLCMCMRVFVVCVLQPIPRRPTCHRVGSR